MKIKIKIAKPRNPCVAACHFRKAGRHGDGNKRQADKVMVRRLALAEVGRVG